MARHASRASLRAWAQAGRETRKMPTTCQNCGASQTMRESNIYDGDCATCYRARGTEARTRAALRKAGVL